MNHTDDHTREHDLDSLRDLVELSTDIARKSGASASEVAASRTAGLDVNVRLGEVETIEHTRDNSLGVTVYFGDSKGSASSTDFRAPAVRETVRGRVPNRPAYRAGRVRRTRRCRADGRRSARSRPVSPVDDHRRRGNRARAGDGNGGAGPRSPHHELGWRVRVPARRRLRVRQLPRLPGGLLQQPQQRELRGHRGGLLGHAARLLVLDRTGPGVPRAPRRKSA